MGAQADGTRHDWLLQLTLLLPCCSTPHGYSIGSLGCTLKLTDPFSLVTCPLQDDQCNACC